MSDSKASSGQDICTNVPAVVTLHRIDTFLHRDADRHSPAPAGARPFSTVCRIPRRSPSSAPRRPWPWRPRRPWRPPPRRRRRQQSPPLVSCGCRLSFNPAWPTRPTCTCGGGDAPGSVARPPARPRGRPRARRGAAPRAVWLTARERVAGVTASRSGWRRRGMTCGGCLSLGGWGSL